MILGIVAAQMLGAGGGSTNQWPDALASADFVNNIYFVGSTEVEAADVIDDPSKLGSGGLIIPHQGATGDVSLLGAFLSVVLGSAVTYVIHWEQTTSGALDQTLLLALTSALPGQDRENIVGRRAALANYLEAWDNQFPFSRAIDTNGVINTITDGSIHKMAFTRSTSRIAMSVNGSSVVKDESDESTGDATLQTLTLASFGGYPDGGSEAGTKIRSLVVWPEQADSALPGLSAL